MDALNDNYVSEYLDFLKKVRLGKRLSQSESGQRTLGVTGAWVSNAELGKLNLESTAPYLAALLTLNTRSRRSAGGEKRAGRRK